MKEISVVIICRNAEKVLSRTLQTLEGLTDDIVVYDSGSTDNTKQIARSFFTKLHEGNWEGFGKTKQKATSLAKYDWILNLDADESVDVKLKNSILNLPLDNANAAYELSFNNHIGNKHLRFGEWGGDKHVRLFNRTKLNWDDAPVHEKLQIPAGTTIQKLPGSVLHYTANNISEYSLKMTGYAMLNAEKYYTGGKRASWLKLHFSPTFNFVRNYIFKLGFLDGYEGYGCAKVNAYYTFLKYARLKELNREARLSKR